MDMNELQGLLQPTAQDRQDALTHGLLSLGSGLLANSTGHYGQFAPAWGQGLQAGLQGYQGGLNQARENRMQDIGMRLKLAEWKKKQDQEQKTKEILDTLTPEQQRIYALGGGDALVRTQAASEAAQQNAELKREQWQRDEALRRDLANQASADRRYMADVSRKGQDKAPSGYRFTSVGELEAIPGGPADIKKQGQLNADNASMTAATSAMSRLAEFANELKMHPGLGGITGLRGAIPNIPGSDAANAQAKLETLKSQVAFGVLQAMRDASKTGGALGAVSEKELSLLQNNLAALDKAQSQEEFQKSLDRVIQYTQDATGRIRNAYNMKHSGAPSQQPAGGGAKFLGFE